jgi:hypothetical protein
MLFIVFGPEDREIARQSRIYRETGDETQNKLTGNMETRH